MPGNMELSSKKSRLICVVSNRCVSRICQIVGVDLRVSSVEAPVSLVLQSCGTTCGPVSWGACVIPDRCWILAEETACHVASTEKLLERYDAGDQQGNFTEEQGFQSQQT